MTCGWSRRMVRSPSCSGRASRCQPLPGFALVVGPVGDPFDHALDRHKLGRRSLLALPADHLDLAEPVQPAREPRDLAVMAEGRIDEAVGRRRVRA